MSRHVHQVQVLNYGGSTACFDCLAREAEVERLRARAEKVVETARFHIAPHHHLHAIDRENCSCALCTALREWEEGKA